MKDQAALVAGANERLGDKDKENAADQHTKVWQTDQKQEKHPKAQERITVHVEPHFEWPFFNTVFGGSDEGLEQIDQQQNK